MFKIIFKYNKNRKGSAIVFVVFTFLIVTILSSSIFFLFSSNLKMATLQEENMRVHYLALAGIDVTKATLISSLGVEDGVEKTMFQKIRESNIQMLEDNITIDGQLINIKVTYDKDVNEDVITISSTAPLKSGGTKTLSLQMEFSGNQYLERWARR